MFNTPTDCYNYIIENDLEMPVLGAMMNHVGGYSIAEIADGRFHNRDGAVSFSSPGYKINIPVTDDEIVTAVHTEHADSIITEEIFLEDDATPQQRHVPLTPAKVLSWLPADATPAQQDSAIQAHIKPSEIHWSECPDTLHLPGHPAGRSFRDVSLPKYYRESYFEGKPCFNPDLFGGRQGVAGDPVPYSIARDNVITILLLACFMLALIAYAKSRRFILRQVKDFFRAPRGENMTVMTETSGEFRFQFFLVGQSCLLFALIYFFYVQTRGADTFIVDLQGGGIFAHGFRLLRPQAQRAMDEVVPLPPCDGRSVRLSARDAASLLRNGGGSDACVHGCGNRSVQNAGFLAHLHHLFQARGALFADFFVLLHT